MDNREEWAKAARGLTTAMKELGYPEEFASAIIQSLKSPKAIARMTSYIKNAKPKSAEMIADEMVAIQSEIETWKRKKTAEEANARYNAWLYERQFLKDEDED